METTNFKPLMYFWGGAMAVIVLFWTSFFDTHVVQTIFLNKPQIYAVLSLPEGSQFSGMIFLDNAAYHDKVQEAFSTTNVETPVQDFKYFAEAQYESGAGQDVVFSTTLGRYEDAQCPPFFIWNGVAYSRVSSCETIRVDG
ncbi:TPA: hypothetical protein DCZ81_04045 [Candidatus Collierbacteria bacterium]|nr:MAG: hypothetical protein UW48_C0009G0023 [Microgenomates group bacterium GW2011_GWC1_44_23]KKT95252.1 MAG: hypothetical protein UW96_C0009G0023 [Candidatus Collierbacteria bacterium GW2011_GWA1_45_15]HBC45312.1 hypothetical protein [Candidatus Collierbacteria bacterium]